MPIYELRCESCGHEFEELVFRRSEVEKLACPKCGGPKVGLLLSAFATGASSKGSSGASTGGSCGSSGGFS
jgi:putative FmdB family regulatory protein